MAKRLIDWLRRLVWGIQDDTWLARHRAEFEEFKRLHSHLFEVNREDGPRAPDSD